MFIVFSVSVHVIDSSTACWNQQRAVCDICRCLLGAAPCFPRLTSALPDGSRETHRATQDGNTGFSSWGACSLREMRWGILSLSFAVGWCMSAGFEVTTQAWWGRTHGDRLLFLLLGSKTEFLKCVWKREKEQLRRGLVRGHVPIQSFPWGFDIAVCVCLCAFPATLPAGFLPEHCNCAAHRCLPIKETTSTELIKKASFLLKHKIICDLRKRMKYLTTIQLKWSSVK